MYQKKATEMSIQQGCVRWFAMQYPQLRKLLIHVTNEGKRSYVQGKQLVKGGLVKGVADLILFIPNKDFHALCIEMKTQSKSSKQTTEQKEWQTLVETQGYKYVICRSLDDFINEINSYLPEKIRSICDDFGDF